jgi:hypothetical protein
MEDIKDLILNGEELDEWAEELEDDDDDWGEDELEGEDDDDWEPY